MVGGNGYVLDGYIFVAIIYGVLGYYCVFFLASLVFSLGMRVLGLGVRVE
jgi:hypothetical protein